MTLTIAAVVVFVAMFIGELYEGVLSLRSNKIKEEERNGNEVLKYLNDMEEAYVEDMLRTEEDRRHERVRAIIERTRHI